MANEKPSVALSAAEWEVMKIFWDHGPLAARDVFARLPKRREWAYKTVKTLLSRLVAKEALAYDQIGNSYLYRPVVDREDMTRRGAQRLREAGQRGVFADSAQFIEEADLSDADIRQLKRLLNEKRKKPHATR